MMATPKQDLAKVFSSIDNASAAVDDVAKGILAAIRDAKADSLDKFNDMVAEAYKANSWSQTIGRPAPGTTEAPAPRAVKLYVSNVRAAYRLHLQVLEFQTMRELRDAVSEVRKQKQAGEKPAEKAEELRGISISRGGKLIGAPFHDAAVVWQSLDDEDRVAFVEGLEVLLVKFRRKAMAQLKAAA